MYGHPNNFRPSGDGGGRSRPVAQPQDPNLLLQNPNLLFQNPNFHLQNPNFPFLPNPNFPFHQNPNFLVQNPNFPIQNPNFMVQNPNLVAQNPHLPIQNNYFPPQQVQSSPQTPLGALDRNRRPGDSVSNPNIPTHNPNLPKGNYAESQPQSSSQKSSVGLEKIDRAAANARHNRGDVGGSVSSPKFLAPNPKFQVPDKNLPPHKNHNIESHPQSISQNSNKSLEKIDRSVAKARRKIISAGESVSAWNVSLAALAKLKVDSWSSLGLQMQEVPSLLQLMKMEGKVI